MPATTDAPTIVTTTDAAPSPARGTSSPLAESTTTPFHERDHPAADHGVIALDDEQSPAASARHDWFARRLSHKPLQNLVHQLGGRITP